MKRDINLYLDKVLAVIGVVFGTALLAGGLFALLVSIYRLATTIEIDVSEFLLWCPLYLFLGWSIMWVNFKKLRDMRNPVALTTEQKRLSAEGDNFQEGNDTEGQVIKRCVHYLNKVWAVIGIIVGAALLAWGWGLSDICESKSLSEFLSMLLREWPALLFWTCVTSWIIVVNIKGLLDKDNSVTVLSHAMEEAKGDLPVE